MKGIYLKLLIVGYTIFVLCHNLFEIALILPTTYYYVFETGFMLMVLFIDYTNSSKTDKMFINYARLFNTGILICLLLSLFEAVVKQYFLSFIVLSMVISIFGSLIALYLDIRREKR